MVLNQTVFEYDISICVVTLNAREYLRDCLHSIECTSSGLRFEVIVVDNHSSDATLAMLRDEFPWVQVVENGAN